MLIVQEQYLQAVLLSPADVVQTFGLGESSQLQQALQMNHSYTLWNSDVAAADFDKPLYGSHPFFMQVTEDGSAHGVMLMNSNALRFQVRF